MKIVNVSEKQVKEVTMFLIQNKLIFHPVISPEGTPDFTDYYGRKYILIIDRNITTKLIDLCVNGTLKDPYILKVIGSIMFWALFNNINITAGVALNEYAHHKNANFDASRENNIFLEIFDFYNPIQWLNLALGKEESIPKIELSMPLNEYIFNIENDHFKMHYAEVLHISYLLLDNRLNNTDRMIEFLNWNNQHLLFCQYTIVYTCLLFSNKIKQLKLERIDDIFRKCKNQAWDLTYLSFWSTLYWDGKYDDEIFLFSTMDRDLKKIFINTHQKNDNLFTTSFGDSKGSIIQNEFQRITSNRRKPNITTKIIEQIINNEEACIKRIFPK